MRTALAAIAAATFMVAACGKIGDPQAPLRPVPVAVANLTAERVSGEVTLRFSVPGANLDGSSPPRVDGVEIYALTQPAGAPAPTPAQLAVAAYRIARIDVRRADQKPSGTAGGARPAAGEAALYVDKPQVPIAGTSPVVRYYAVAGTIGNRRGPTSRILALPLSASPDPPAGIMLDYTEQSLRLTWTAGPDTARFVVEEVDSSGAKAQRLTVEPIAGVEFSAPIEFGRTRCFSVRTADTGTGVTSLGPPSAPHCVTPMDKFPPAAPTSLLAVPADGAIELVWNASAAADLAGYIVLRAEGADGTLQPLTPAPIIATQYRDPSVKAGVTYAYEVVAVDKATPPNRSGASNRFVVTARRP